MLSFQDWDTFGCLLSTYKVLPLPTLYKRQMVVQIENEKVLREGIGEI